MSALSEGERAGAPAVSALSATFAKDLNCLKDPRAFTRKKALKRFVEYFTTNKAPEDNSFALFYDEHLKEPLHRLLADAVEKCREFAVEILELFAGSILKDTSSMLSDACEAMLPRLGVRPFVETAEEIRLQCLAYLNRLVNAETTSLAALQEAGEHILQIAGNSLYDPFSKVKKTSADILVCILTRNQKASAPIVIPDLAMKNLLANLGHNRREVRAASLRAFGVCLRFLAVETVDSYVFETALPTFRRLITDRSPSVQREMVVVAAECCVHLTISVDTRGRLVQLLLSGIASMSSDIRELCIQSLARVHEEKARGDSGRHVDAIESEKSDGDSRTMTGDSATRNSTRIVRTDLCQLTCDDATIYSARHVLDVFLPTVLPAVVSEIQEWTKDRRGHGLNVLFGIVAVGGYSLTVHAKSIFVALAHACRDDDDVVAERAQLIAELLGHNLKAEDVVAVFVALLEPKESLAATLTIKQLDADEIKDDPRKARQIGFAGMSGLCTILSALLKGLDEETLKPRLPTLVNCLGQHDISGDHLTEFRVCIVETVHDVLDLITKKPGMFTEPIVVGVMRVVTSVQANEVSALVHQQATDAIRKLAAISSEQFNADIATCELYDMHFAFLLEELVGVMSVDTAASIAAWKKRTPERCAFDLIVRGCEGAIANHLDACMPYFLATLNPETDNELQICNLALLDTVLRSCSGGGPASIEMLKHGATILQHMLLPNCVWRVGRVASTVRKIALKCMEAAVSNHLVTADDLFQCITDVTAAVKSCLSDDDAVTRKLMCHILMEIFLVLKGRLPDDLSSELYPEVLQRLDDSNDTIRVLTCRVLAAMFHAASAHFWNGTPLDYTLDQMFVHLDDIDETIQASVYGAILEAIDLNPKLIAKKANKKLKDHRKPDYLLQILDVVEKNMAKASLD